jgi:galactose mutarotase-like enzyme
MADGCLTRTGKENVLIQSGDCSVNLLPEFGGKIASICVRNQELLQPPLAEIAPRTRTMVFDASDASGWDECLPSVAACEVKTERGLAKIPDHGDLWRVEWEKTGTREQGNREIHGTRGQGNKSEIGGPLSVTLEGKCFSLPLTLARTIDLDQTAKGWELRFHYKLTNTGQAWAPWSWAAHPLFRVEEGDTVVLPDSVSTVRLEGSRGNRLGSPGGTVRWPMARTADGETDLRVVQAEGSGIAEKLFAGPLQSSEGWCALRRPKAGVTIRFSFDAVATPFLGIWLCYGGWPERTGPRQMCVALEPATAPVDSLAGGGKWTRVLAAGESFTWPLTVEIEGI